MAGEDIRHRDRLRQRAPRSGDTTLLVHEFSPHLPAYTWDIQARVAIRALQLGFSLAGTLHAESLREVMAALDRPTGQPRRGRDPAARRGADRAGVRPAPDPSRRRRPLPASPRARRAGTPPASPAGGARDVGSGDATPSTTSAGASAPELAPRVGMTQADFERSPDRPGAVPGRAGRRGHVRARARAHAPSRTSRRIPCAIRAQRRTADTNPGTSLETEPGAVR